MYPNLYRRDLPPYPTKFDVTLTHRPELYYHDGNGGVVNLTDYLDGADTLQDNAILGSSRELEVIRALLQWAKSRTFTLEQADREKNSPYSYPPQQAF